jgi:hypothetical protein
VSSPQPSLPQQPGPQPQPQRGAASVPGPSHSPTTATNQPVSAMPPAAATKPRGGLLVVTLVVAVFALVVASAGIVVAAVALGRSDDAVTVANAARNQPPPVIPTAEQPTAGPAATGEPTQDPTIDAPDDRTTGPTEINPTAQFDVAYDGEKLRVRSPDCDNIGGKTYVDLDSPPRVGVAEGSAELNYDGCDPGQVRIELPFAGVPGPTATPKDCLEAIRTDPGRSPVAPARGMTLCVVTSQDKAAAEGTTQKLVFVTIDAITVDNGTGVLNITAKAWTVPQ